MSSTFVTLNIPPGQGVGTSTDVHLLAPDKTLVIGGVINPATGEQVIVEGTLDPAGVVGWFGLASFVGANEPPRTVGAVVYFMRVRRVFASPLNAPNVELGCESGVTTPTFYALTIPTLGAGPSVDISAGGSEMTFMVTGGIVPSDGNGNVGEIFTIEGSNDGTNWNGIISFSGDNQGHNTFVRRYNFVRVNRNQNLGSTPSALVGTCTLPGEGASGVTQIVAGVNVSISPAGGVGVVTINANGTSASWPLANPRIFAVDGISGNDANLGYADAAGTSTLQYEAACAAAGLVAKRTIAGLAAIFPAIGAGRLAVILIRSGSYADDLGTALNGIEGYAAGSPLVRGTITDATAGSVAFAGTPEDETMSGGVTAPGMNAAGYHPTGAPTSSQFQCLKVGGGGPAFAAEPAVPLGWRVRYDNNAPTQAALRGQCRQVCQVTGSDTLLLQTALPAVPVNTDVFYLEQAGVVIPAFDYFAPPNGQAGTQFSGIRCAGTWSLQFADVTLAFCGAAVFACQQQTVNELLISQSFNNPILGTITPGGGLRSEGAATINQGYMSLLGLVSATVTTLVSDQVPLWGAGCAARNLQIFATRAGQNLDTLTPATFGTTAATGLPHTFGTDGVCAVLIDGSDVTFQQMNVIGAGGTPDIKLKGRCNVILAGAVGGFAGNTDVGLDLSDSAGSTVQINANAAPTFTGSVADVRWAGPAFGTWTQFQFQEQYDTAGNHIYQVVQNAEYDYTITPSVSLGVNNSGGTANGYNLMTHNGSNFQFKPAVPGSTIVGVLDRQTGNGEAALLGAPVGYRLVNFDAAPALQSLVYISTTPGLATSTNPGNQAPLGIVVATGVGNTAVVLFVSGINSASPSAANWPVGIARVYAIDGAGGNDANQGYADPVSNSLADFQAASVTAGTVAVKTYAGLAKIFPRLGQGRMAVIIIAQGTYVGGLDAFNGGTFGYRDGFPLIRGTVTNATALSVAFSSSDGDRTMVGAVTATGMHATGYNPIGGATTTSLPCLQVGGGAPGFTAGGLAVPIGWRIRFDANAPTQAALRNQAVGVSEIPANNTLVPTLPFNAVPNGTDVFYLEMAGVACDATTLDGANDAGLPLIGAGAPLGSQIVGISVGNLNIVGGLQSPAFCGCTTLNVGAVQAGNCPAALQTSFGYQDPFAFFFVGGGLRCEGQALLGTANYNETFGLVVAGNLEYNAVTGLQFQDGCAVRRLLIGNSYLGTSIGPTGAVGPANLGTNFFDVQPPILRGTGAGTSNGLSIVGSTVQIQALNIQGAGAAPAISVRGASIVVLSGTVAGVTGNNDVGLDLTNARGALIVITQAGSVTGALGDIRLAGGQIISWAQAVLGIVDSKGNRIVGTTSPTGILTFTGAILGGAGAAVSYLADNGIIGAVNQTTAFRRATSQRLMTRLRVTCISTTAVNAVTVTLYKNGAAQAMQVSIPSGTGANTKFVDSAHPIFYTDGDDFDLRLDDAADVGALVNVSAGLEYAA